jgi:hypothetical protein
MFTLTPNSWAAWQMIPGYLGERCVPYCSPIWINSVTPLKKGTGRLQLSFQNVLYAVGVQDFTLNLVVLKRAENFLIANIDYGADGQTDRIAVISHIEFDWIRRFCPELWWNKPPSSYSGNEQSSVSQYLSTVFSRNAD